MYTVISVNDKGKPISNFLAKKGFTGIKEGDFYDHPFEGLCKVVRIEKEGEYETLFSTHNIIEKATGIIQLLFFVSTYLTIPIRLNG